MTYEGKPIWISLAYIKPVKKVEGKVPRKAKF